jgi:hypothetical protein
MSKTLALISSRKPIGRPLPFDPNDPGGGEINQLSGKLTLTCILRFAYCHKSARSTERSSKYNKTLNINGCGKLPASSFALTEAAFRAAQLRFFPNT